MKDQFGVCLIEGAYVCNYDINSPSDQKPLYALSCLSAIKIEESTRMVNVFNLAYPLPRVFLIELCDQRNEGILPSLLLISVV